MVFLGPRLLNSKMFCPARAWRPRPKLGSILLRRMIWAGLLASLFWLATAHSAPLAKKEPRLYINYSSRPDPADLLAFDLCILDANAQIDLKPAREMGHQCLAYISTVEARPGTPMAKLADSLKISRLGRNETWGSDLLDVSHRDWEYLIVERLAKASTERGFDGFFLDTIDSVALLAPNSPERTAEYRARITAMIRKLHQRFPDKKIVLNRGFDLLKDVGHDISGVLVESVYQTCDIQSKRHRAVDAKGSEWLESRIRDVQMLGLPVYAVDYVDPALHDLAAKTARRLADIGCIPFVTTPELDGTVLAPLRAASRRILTLFGWDPKTADKPATWPIDTLVADHFQAPLEWLGYEVDYLDVGKKPLSTDAAKKFAGVILDEFLTFRPQDERSAAQWLIALKDRGIPVLFAGSIPFADDDVREELISAFGFSGTARPVHGVTKPSIGKLDGDMMGAETPVIPRSIGFKDVTAPSTAEIFLSIRGEDRLGNDARFDPVFLTTWGGMWLEPYIALRASQDDNLYYADPYRFLARWLGGNKPFPAPDTTTRDGRRLFYTHIDGDGFVSLTHFPGHPTCAEVIRDRILTRFPFPVTVSVIEADIRSWLKVLKPEDAPRYEKIARSIFDLGHVRAASHAFTHPFVWDPADPNPGTYDMLNVTLNDEQKTKYPAIDLTREIKGSIDYINERLLPPGKKVELMLWSGNCRPGPRALQICRDLGIENMNGGDTIISKLHPGLSGVAPRVMPWNDELQIFAANQNEFMYANGFQGPYFGGFDTLIDTFERTEKPRRLKPVNIYYHFYSATYLSSMRSLEKIHQWCLEQPLHPVTALDYAKIVRDARDTKIFHIATNHWLIANTGKSRTLRVPASAGLPDMQRSKGIVGFKTEGDQTYIHTSGNPLVELVLAHASSESLQHLRLVESSADVKFHELNDRRAILQVGGVTDVTVILGGIAPGTFIDIKKHREQGRLQSTPEGTVTLTLKPGAVVTLTVTAPPHVSAS